jgi:hypothetical protein
MAIKDFRILSFSSRSAVIVQNVPDSRVEPYLGEFPNLAHDLLINDSGYILFASQETVSRLEGFCLYVARGFVYDVLGYLISREVIFKSAFFRSLDEVNAFFVNNFSPDKRERYGIIVNVGSYEDR